MPELSAAQQKLALRKPPENLEAWEIFLHGQWWRSRFTREDFTEARLLLLDAVRLDPEMSMAHALIADIGLWSLSMNWAADPSATSEEAQKHVTRALTLDAGNAHAHACMAWLKFYTGHHAEAREEGETAIRLNPSYAEGHLYLGNLYLYLGEPKAAIEEQEIMRNLRGLRPARPVRPSARGVGCSQPVAVGSFGSVYQGRLAPSQSKPFRGPSRRRSQGRSAGRLKSAVG